MAERSQSGLGTHPGASFHRKEEMFPLLPEGARGGKELLKPQECWETSLGVL